MATVSLLVGRATPLLPADSRVQHAFICQTAPSFGVFVLNWATGLGLPWIIYRCVAVTDDAIFVMASPKLSGGAQPSAIVATLPRRTQLGPVSGQWGELRLLGQRYWVKKRFQKEVTDADADAGFIYTS